MSLSKLKLLQMRVLLAFFQSLKLAKFTAAYLQFHPVKKNKQKKTKLAITKNASSVSRQETERFILNYKQKKTLLTKIMALECK